MKKILLIYSLIHCIASISIAQDVEESRSTVNKESAYSRDSLIHIVLENNKTIVAATRMLEASKVGSKTGLTPSDPQLEFGYLSGFPASIGDRIDFRVEQEFDFPTVYWQMSKMKNLRTGEAEILYDLTRQEIILKARKLFIERIYLNQLEQMITQRFEKAEILNAHYVKLVESGEFGQLSLSQSNLQTLMLKSELEQLKTDLEANKEALLEISGGMITDFPVIDFPVSDLESISNLRDAYYNSLKLQLYEKQLNIKETNEQIALSKALPKFSAGYYSETVITERFRGVSVGMSIPLWEHANTLKYAKAEILHAEADKERFKSEQDMKLTQNNQQWTSLKKQVEELRKALSSIDDESLLNVALEIGEISLSEYLFSSELYFQNRKKLMEYERDLHMIEAELMKVYY